MPGTHVATTVQKFIVVGTAGNAVKPTTVQKLIVMMMMRMRRQKVALNSLKLRYV